MVTANSDPNTTALSVPLPRALELAAERLGVDDLDYAKIRLREVLEKEKAKLGRDWGAQAVAPSGTCIDNLWRRPGAWRITWESGRAKLPRTVTNEPAEVFGIWIALTVIAELTASSFAPQPPPKPVVSRTAWLKEYLTEECRTDLKQRYKHITPATEEIHELMKIDPTVEAYAHARNIERYSPLRKLFPSKCPPTKKKKR